MFQTDHKQNGSYHVTPYLAYVCVYMISVQLNVVKRTVSVISYVSVQYILVSFASLQLSYNTELHRILAIWPSSYCLTVYV